uniref:Proliferation-associated protein 2G4 (Trinotate prediction) n=1 Tax=Henneguya salminicola TaxID=69463 RepID=A0A6G3MEI5_HENSL
MADDHSECSSCEEKEQNPSDSSIMNKYKTAGEIATSVMKELSSNCISGSTVTELCTLGDHLILSQVGKVFSKNKKLKKGIGFPTCISLNNVICHMSPLKSEPETIISDGDVVKIDLGVHIDGCMACLATTLIVGADKTNPTTGRRADVIMAGYMASEIILKLFRPKNTNHIITQAITDVVSEFQCKPVEGRHVLCPI